MRRPAILPFLPAALLLACGGNPAPTLSTDFRAWGLPIDAAGEAPADVPDPRDAHAGADDIGSVLDAPADAGPDAVPGDLPTVDGVTPDCESGGIRGVPCGFNGKGVQPQSCVDGAWKDGGPCEDPDECANGGFRTQPCGLNGRGSKQDDCTDGHWVPGECVDPDICSDGTSTVLSCGKNDAGRQAQTCKSGSWAPDGPCVTPGRWRCIDNVCTPVYGDPACGDGTCNPRIGESRTSCPADCDPGDVDGQGQDCNQAIDCAFYAWRASGPGYWECRGLLRGTCNAVVTNQYCGTPGWDYCYLSDPSALETDRSCPQDCTPQYLNCGSDLECIFQDWNNP